MALFQIPTKDDEYSTVWRNKLVAIITKGQIERRMLYICERHYTEAQINRREYITISCSLLCEMLAS